MKLKQLVTAVALVAAGVPAMATISLPSTGNGELVAVVLDRVDQVSYLVDLGLSMDPGVTGAVAFDATQNFSLALNSQNFSNFLTATNVSANTLEFAVMAGDQVGSTASSPKRLWTTINTDPTAMTNGILTNSTGNLATFENYQALSATGQTHTTVDNGDGWAAAGNNAYFLQFAGDTFNGQTSSAGWANTNLAGTAAAMRTFATSSTSGGGATVQTTLGGTWTLDQVGTAYTLNYTAQVAAVPEADGLVLLAAGLTAMGFVGRRRKEG